MFKKFMALALVFVLMLGFIPSTAFAGEIVAEGTCGENLTWTLDDEGTLTISGSGAMEDYSDDTYSDDTTPWYIFCSSIRSVILPNGITYIGRYAFSRCSRLTSVTIPGSVTSIGEDAFYRCSSLTSVAIPGSVTSIGEDAFAFCSALTSVTIPDSVTSIGDGVFYSCDSLTSVTIPDSVTSIGRNAFSHCDSLTSVTIPDSVTSIGDYAFARCDSLTSVTIPDSVTSIGEDAFYHCDSLTSITIPDSVTSISFGAFSYCSSLTSVTIPDSVTSIGDCAFCYCDSLTSVTIPDSVTSIGDGVFYSCDSLTSVTIPDSVTSIGEDAFYHCESLTSVTIPDSVTSIGRSAFSCCDSLTGIWVLEGNACYSNDDFGVLFDKSKSVVVQAPGALNGVYVIPDSVSIIGEWAFSGCSSLTSVTIPDSVTSIGKFAFSYCSSLTSVTIPDGVTSIDLKAFVYCRSLTSVTIPDSVTSIGIGAFGGCSSLTSVTIPDSVTSIGYVAFSQCSSLTSVTIPDSVTSIGDYALAYCSSMETIYFSGDAPVFDGEHVFNDVIATAYYPNDNATWTSDVMLDYGGTLTWVPYDPEGGETPGDDTKTVPDGYDFEDDSLCFRNYSLLFKISKKYFTTMYGKTKGSLLYAEHSRDLSDGMCYGMSTVTGAIYNGIPASTTFTTEHLLAEDEPCEVIRDIEKGSVTSIEGKRIALEDYIKYAHIYQMSSAIQIDLRRTWNYVEGLQNTVRSYLDNDEVGVLVCMIHHKADSAHAVLAVGMEGNKILIDDPNNSEGLEYLTINEDGTWSYSLPWESDGINSENSTIHYTTDLYTPCEVIAYGNTVETTQVETDSGIVEENYVNGMDQLDEENLLLSINSDCYTLNNSNVSEIMIFAADEQTEESASDMFWILDDKTIDISDTDSSGSTVAVAGNNVIMRVDVDSSADISLSADTENTGLQIAAEPDALCTFTFETITSEAEVALSVSTTADSETITAVQTENGICITGITAGTVTMTENGETIDSETISSSSGAINVLYNDEGGNEDIQINYENPFTDVSENSFCYTPVLWAVEKGITKGLTDTTFGPNESCTRGQVVTFLWRAAGSPEPTSTEHSFVDVSEKAYYYKAMLWAVENGITKGTDGTHFSPNAVCNRGTVVTFLWRAKGETAPTSTEHSFTDVSEKAFYYKAMLWAVENGITKGLTTTTFGPNSSCNRGQVVTFLYRAYA